jgi:hypothetical protein
VLPPLPDFRYVGLDPYRPRGVLLAGALATGAGAFVFASSLIGPGRALLAACGVAGAALFSQRLRRNVHSLSKNAAPTSMAIVPWGVIIADEVAPRVLRWASARHVEFDTVHGREDGAPTALYSVVRLRTDREELCGMTAGAAPLERLVAYLHAYDDEQHHALATDLDGDGAIDPLDPQVGLLLESARGLLATAPPALGLASGGYRLRYARAGTPITVDRLRGVLRDRTARSPDPRAFAAVLAAELGLRDLAPDLLSLVQSPHPVLAAVAKRAALLLGVPTSKAGSLDEIAPFLGERDLELLSAWRPAVAPCDVLDTST